MTDVPIRASDRLGFTVFLAVAVHALLIFGLGFAPGQTATASRTLDVTLAQYQSDRPDADPDFIAQVDQSGSGDQDQAAELTTTQPADFADARIQTVQLVPPATLDTAGTPTLHTVVATRGASPLRADPRPAEPAPLAADLPHADQEQLAALSQEIASLQARLDAQQQAYARRPRIHRVTSVSARAHYEAEYVDQFRRAVEAMGTRHFPARALNEQRFGDVRLMVALRADGSVSEIRLLGSSGHDFLDDAAIQSVRRAEPFPPFRGELRQRADILEIIRTWRFDTRRLLTSH